MQTMYNNKHSETYDPIFFERLKKAEKDYFWFVVRRKWILDAIRRFIPPPAQLLEVGCGTGNVSSFLAEKGYKVTGYEFYREAIDLAWPGFSIVQGDAKELPFENERFDIVGLFDVIEHFEDDFSLLREIVRVVKKGGIIAVTVPAREELWSWVDEVSMHKRRYTKKKLRQLYSQLNLNPCVIEYMFMSLYIPMKYMRQKSVKHGDPFKIHSLMNGLLIGFFNAERIISKKFSLPIGTSLLGIARKEITY